MNLLSLSLRNLRRLILAWLCCMRGSARESRVSVVIHSFDVVGRPGLHQPGLVSTCFADCSSPGPRKNDLTIYWALGPFVRSFTLLVDPGDICPPQFPPPDAGGRGGTPAHAKAGPGSPPAPARMMKILEAEGGAEAAARLASPHHRTGGHPPA